MSQIDELISKLQEVSNHPQKTVLNYKKQGKGLVGMMPYYAPEEIVYAAGYLPVGMFGSQNPQISAARTYLPPFACSLMQADMELQLNGTYDCLDAVIFSVPCDTLRCMSQKWHGKAPVIVFTQPQNRKIRPAVDFLKAEYEHVRTELERILNVKISDLAIQEAIKVYNENRQVMREFCDVAAQYPQIFTPVKRHDVIKARWFMDKAEHTALVRELIDAVKKEPVQPWNGKKVILNVKISDLAIQEAIKVYNENRQVMREFCDVAAQYPQIFTPVKRHDVIKARWFMDKAEHTALVRELIDAVKKEPVQPWNGKKVILSGIMAEPDEFLDIFSEFNIAVVADDLAQESRQFRTDVPSGIDPLEQLAQQWQDFDGCPLALNEDKPRGQMLIDMTKKYNADAVVICMMRFCDPEEFDYPIYKPEFEAAGVRYTVLDLDIESPSLEQLRTRIQAFSEIL